MLHKGIVSLGLQPGQLVLVGKKKDSGVISVMLWDATYGVIQDKKDVESFNKLNGQGTEQLFENLPCSDQTCRSANNFISQ